MTALPQLCDSRRFLNATCGQQPVIAGDSSAKIKGCRQTEQLSNVRGKTRGHFLCKILSNLTKIAVVCDVLRCIVKFRFSKQWVAVKLHTVALNMKYCQNFVA